MRVDDADHEAHRVDGYADVRQNPVGSRFGGPAVPEEADGRKEGAEEHDGDAEFWLANASVLGGEGFIDLGVLSADGCSIELIICYLSYMETLRDVRCVKKRCVDHARRWNGSTRGEAIPGH